MSDLPDWVRRYTLTPEQRAALIAAVKDGTLINLCWLHPRAINFLDGGAPPEGKP